MKKLLSLLMAFSLALVPMLSFADECSSATQNIYNMRPTEIHYEIADWAIAGNRLNGLGTALWFFNPFSPSCRANFPSNVGTFVMRIGAHCFYNPTAAYYDT